MTCFRAGQVLPGQRVGVGDHLGGRAGGDQLAALDARAGAQVDQPVGGAHGLRVVLDDQDGVAHVAQLEQRVEQVALVARVQANGGLVEDVQHAHQPAAQLRGQADALALAAREGGGRARQVEVVQAHVQHKAQPRAQLFEHLADDFDLFGVEVVGCRPWEERLHTHS